MPKNKVEQWGWNNMEELLQCPVCLEPPYTGIVVQCRSGHHICSTCKLQLDECPLCKCSFGGTRNFVVEELMRNYLVLKNTMLLTSITGENETDGTKTNNINQFAIAAKPKKVSYTIAIDKGVYPCRINGCNVKLPVSRLLNHVRTFHPTDLQETKMNDNKEFAINWQFTYDESKPITRYSQAVFISGIGLVFLNIEILLSGHVIVAVQMGAQLKTCQNFKVMLKVNKENRTFYHTTSMYSCRDNMINLLFRKACLILTHKNILAALHNRKFNCGIEIKPNTGTFSMPDVVQNTQLIRNAHDNRNLALLKEQELALKAKNKVKNGNNRIFVGANTISSVKIVNGASGSAVVAAPSQNRKKRRR